MPEKVTDPNKITTDPVLLSNLEKQGIDKNYVEFVQDYAPRSLGKGHSPYAKFYRDLKSNKRFMVVSGLPMVDSSGLPIEVGWRVAGINYFAEKNNLFKCKVQHQDVELVVRNDQPDGRRAGDKLSYHPLLFLDGVEITPQASKLLPVDPVNSNYLANTIEWDYGICKRRLRIIQGRILGSWVFASKPSGEVRIKYNQTGDYRLKLGQYKINDDEELIPHSVFNEAEYPFIVFDSATYYPDADPETSSVDGYAGDSGNNLTFANLKLEAGTLSSSAGATIYSSRIKSSTTTNQWAEMWRVIFLFDISAIAGATISDVVFSLYGTAKWDNNNATPSVNVYSSNPASNTTIAAGDFVYTRFGTTPYCDTAITYANWIIADPFWNDFIFNAAGITFAQAAADGDGILKLGARDSKHDVGTTDPAWVSAVTSGLAHYGSEQGDGFKPKLVVTYTVLIDYPITSSVLIGTLVSASRLVNYPRSASALIGLLVSATRATTVTRASSVIIGVVASATKAWGRSITSSVIIGVVASATRVVNYPRSASVIIGTLVSATRVAAFTRASSVLVGVLVSATRVFGVNRVSSVIVGVATSATRAVTATRASLVVVGVTVSASRIWGRTRTASVAIGVLVRYSLKTRIMRQLQTFMGRDLSTATGRDLSANNDERDIKP